MKLNPVPSNRFMCLLLAVFIAGLLVSHLNNGWIECPAIDIDIEETGA